MAEHYGTAIVPARPRKPRDKAKVEVAVHIAQRWIVARLRHQRFFLLTDLNAAIRILVDRLNDQVTRHLGASRRDLFEQIERAAPRPLPVEPYVFSEWKQCTVLLIADGSRPACARRSCATSAPPSKMSTSARRKLDRTLFQQLAAGRWIADARNLMITGPCGVGRHGSPAPSANAPAATTSPSSISGCPACSPISRWLTVTAAFRGCSGLWSRRTSSSWTTGVPDRLTAGQRRDLMEIVEDRHGQGSILITS